MSANAATPAEKERARAKAEEAGKRYNLGEFQAALEAYKEAYLLSEAPSMLFNIGQCQRKLGDERGALHSYRSYLRTMPNPPNRSVVEAHIAELEEKLKASEVGDTVKGVGSANPKASDGTPGSAGTVAIPLTPTAAAAGTDPALQLGAPVEQPPLAAPSVFSRWWFWTGAAIVVAGAVTTFLLLQSSPKDPACPVGASCG